MPGGLVCGPHGCREPRGALWGSMEPLVDCVIEDARWDAVGLDGLADRAVRAALADLGLSCDGLTLCLMACDDARIATLNAEFRGKPVATNVLSWPAWDLSAEGEGDAPDLPEQGSVEEPESLGDIALAYDTCLREAAEAAKDVRDHVTHLVVHGTLHLLGYDHVREGDAVRMESTETRILATLGISDPY